MKGTLRGILVAVLSSYPIAILFALVYRFPIPMGGIIGPFGEINANVGIFDIIKMVTIAWIFYGILGGFVVLSVGGAVAGIIIERKYDQNSGKVKLIYIWGVVRGKALYPLMTDDLRITTNYSLLSVL